MSKKISLLNLFIKPHKKQYLCNTLAISLHGVDAIDLNLILTQKRKKKKKKDTLSCLLNTYSNVN